MKKLLLSRRGAAIELAMAVIFLMMALCIILVSVATLQKSQRQKDLNDLDNKIERMQITEKVIDYVKQHPETDDFNIDDVYMVDVEGNIYTVTSEGNTIVTITINDGEITSWN